MSRIVGIDPLLLPRNEPRETLLLVLSRQHKLRDAGLILVVVVLVPDSKACARARG